MAGWPFFSLEIEKFLYYNVFISKRKVFASGAFRRPLFVWGGVQSCAGENRHRAGAAALGSCGFVDKIGGGVISGFFDLNGGFHF